MRVSQFEVVVVQVVGHTVEQGRQNAMLVLALETAPGKH